MDLLVEDIRMALTALGEITGEVKSSNDNLQITKISEYLKNPLLKSLKNVYYLKCNKAN